VSKYVELGHLEGLEGSLGHYILFQTEFLDNRFPKSIYTSCSSVAIIVYGALV
jgi:hypothetical protein